jgi:hypothetical protein
MDTFFCDGLISVLINGVILHDEGTCLTQYTARSLGSPTEIIQFILPVTLMKQSLKFRMFYVLLK